MAALRRFPLLLGSDHWFCDVRYERQNGSRLVSNTLLLSLVQSFFLADKRLSRSNAVAGVGFSVILILVTVVVQLSTPPLLIAAATSVTIVIRTIGGNVGYAIAAAIYGSLSNTQIPENIRKSG